MIDDSLMEDGDLISSIIMWKQGDKEFILSFDGSHWWAAIGNKSTSMAIGEAVTHDSRFVEFYAEADNSTEALRELFRQIQKGSR